MHDRLTKGLKMPLSCVDVTTQQVRTSYALVRAEKLHGAAQRAKR